MAGSYIFDIAAFRVSFPAFSNVVTYPDATLQGYWDVAVLYIANSDYGYLSGDARYRAITLLVAHLAALAAQIAAGNTPGIVQSATIDKITVSMTPPPVNTEFLWWLNLTPYGAQLAALLSVHAVGGFFVTAVRPPRGLR